MKMVYFLDGNQVVVTFPDFIDLQGSPAIFMSRSTNLGKIIENHGIAGLPLDDLKDVYGLLLKEKQQIS